MNEKEMGASELYLAPQTEVFDQAAELVQTTVADTKYPFTLEYDLNEKEYLLSVLNAAGAVVTEENDSANSMTVSMNMSQLRLIKSLDCITRVKTDEGKNMRRAAFEAPQTNNEAVATAAAEAQGMTLANDEVMAANEVNAASADDGIAVACVSGCTTGNNTKETALEISVETVVNGCICCPLAEQWFKFTAPESKHYTIYTKGSLDTIGTLYDCDGVELEYNDNSYGKENFKIKYVLNAGETYYVKVKCYGNNTGSYKLNITKCVLVDSVDINKSYMILGKNVLYELPVTPNHTNTWYKGAHKIPGFSVTLDPDNADNKTVWWSSDSSGILDVSQGWDNKGNRYAHLIGTEKGVAKLYAEDWNRNGTGDECMVYIGCAPVTGIKLDYTTKTISLDFPEKLNASVTPSMALNQEVIWKSSNDKVVIVDDDGWVTGLKKGTAIITAKSDEGGFEAKCTVTVDPRPKVTVIKDTEYSRGDEEYFNIVFQDGRIWRNIGCDLNLEENCSGKSLTEEEYHYHQYTDPEKRYVDNIKTAFSASEIAYIYLLDPLGIEFYMRTNATAKMSEVDGALFKDEVYEAIFGDSERKRGKFFFYDFNGEVQYDYYTVEEARSHRNSIYSNAEVLFGFHNEGISWDWSEFLKTFLEGLFDWVMEDSVIGKGIQAYQCLFHSGGIVGVGSDEAESYIRERAENDFKNKLVKKYGEKFAEKAKKSVHWLVTLITILCDSTISAVDIPNPHDITIYNKVDNYPDYLTIIDRFNSEITMKDLIEQANQD